MELEFRCCSWRSNKNSHTKIFVHAPVMGAFQSWGVFWRTRTETCFWRQILDQKHDGIATRKRERTQEIVFNLWRVQSWTFLKIHGVINILAKWNLLVGVLVINLKDIFVYEQLFHYVLTHNWPTTEAQTCFWSGSRKRLILHIERTLGVYLEASRRDRHVTVRLLKHTYQGNGVYA